MTFNARATILAVGLVLGCGSIAAAQPPRQLYTQALARDRSVRDARQAATLRQIRAAVAAYERVVRKYPASGYADNALWQASELSRLAWDRFGEESDKRTGVRLLKQLQAGYPASSLISGVDQALANFDTTKAMATTGSGSGVVRPTSSSPRPVTTTARAETPEAAPNGVVTVRAINRTAMPDGIRVSIEMDREVLFRQERLDNPKRLFFDLRGAYLSPGLRAKNLNFNDDIVKEIRLGRQPQNTTRVVMDLEGVDTYSVFTLYNPYRVVVDFRRKTTINASAATTAPPPAAAPLAPAAPPALPPARPRIAVTPLPPPVPVAEAVVMAPLTSPPPPPLPLNAPKVVAGVSLNKMRAESKPVRTEAAAAGTESARRGDIFAARAAAFSFSRSARSAGANGAARELQRAVLARAAARPRHQSHRHRPRSRRARSRASAATASTNRSSCSTCRSGCRSCSRSSQAWRS